MESKEYYISLIASHTEELRKDFGVKSLRLFGSVARNEQKVGSDVDICVDIEAIAYTLYFKTISSSLGILKENVECPS